MLCSIVFYNQGTNEKKSSVPIWRKVPKTFFNADSPIIPNQNFLRKIAV